MDAYKGFNANLTCTRGKGTFQYEEGKTYTEEKANCAKNGFHCAENPMDCLTWYENLEESAYYLVKAGGDIDDQEDKISCTEITLIRRLDALEFTAAVCEYYWKYEKRKFIERKMGWMQCAVDKIIANAEAKAVIVRGKHPRAAAPEGCLVAFVRELQNSSKVSEIRMIRIDGEEFKANVMYEFGKDGALHEQKRS